MVHRDGDGNELGTSIRVHICAGSSRLKEPSFACRYDIDGVLSRLGVFDTEPSNQVLFQIEFRYDHHQDLVAVISQTGRTWQYQYQDHL